LYNIDNKQNNNIKYTTSSLGDKEKDLLLNRLLQLLKEDKVYKDQDISLEKLSEKIGTNRTYLSQIINDYASSNFNTFINSFRIDDARAFLADPKNQNLPIKSIYDKFGFKSDKYFCEVFKKQTGFTPFVFRKDIRI